MNLNEIAAFVAVVDGGGFTAAERATGVAKTTLSRQVQRLEENLGVQLLARTTRSVVLTDAGRALYRRSASAMAELADAQRAALDVVAVPTGLLRVASMAGIDQLLGALVAELVRRHPQVRVEVAIQHRTASLVAEGFDVAIRSGFLDDSTLVARLLYTARLALACSHAYADTYGLPATPSDLPKHRLALFGPAAPRGLLRLRGPDGWEEVRVEPLLTVNSFDVVAAMIGSGDAIGLVERAAAAQSDVEWIGVLPDYEIAPGAGVYAVYPASTHLTPKVRAFVDLMVEMVPPYFARRPAWAREP